MELKRLGLRKKNMIIVPNHLVEQWGKEFVELYPNAKVLLATKKDFQKANRQRLISRIATGDWDAVIIGHTHFGAIPVSRETEKGFIEEQIRTIEEAILIAQADGMLIVGVAERQKKTRL